MKICIVLPSLGGGGAERLHVNLIKEWLLDGHDAELVILASSDQNNVLQDIVPINCKVTFLGTSRIRSSLFTLTKYFFKNKYDVVLAAMWPITVITVIASLISSLKNRPKIFVSEHTMLSVSRSHELNVSEYAIRITSNIFYRFVNGIIAVSGGVRDDISNMCNIRKEKISVIHNPAAIGIKKPTKEEIEAFASEFWKKDIHYKLLAVGTLKQQKGFDILINAFNLFPEEIKKDCQLIILGEGPERKNLEGQIDKLNLKNFISLPGFQIDPYPWFFSADLFVLSSRWEGFGNVIVEALEAGVTVVSTDCKSGPAEILENGRHGYLVASEDSEGLATSIVHALENKFSEKDLINRASEYSAASVSKKYLEYFWRN